MTFRFNETHSSAAEQTQSPQRNALCCSRADAVCTAFERARSTTGRLCRSSGRSQVGARRHPSAPRSASRSEMSHPFRSERSVISPRRRPQIFVRGHPRPFLVAGARETVQRGRFAKVKRSLAQLGSVFFVGRHKGKRTSAVRRSPAKMSARACQVCKTELGRAKLEASRRPAGPPNLAWVVEASGQVLLPLLSEKRRCRVLACQPEA